MSENLIIEQSKNLLDLADTMIDDLDSKISRLYSDSELRSFKSAFLTGCGDSYIAGPAAKEAFEEFSGIPCEPCLSIDATYHLPEDKFTKSTYKTLAIGISISGTAAGTVNAMMNCSKLGAETLAVTENINSPLARRCGKILELSPSPAAVVPGTKTYFSSILALVMIALHIGVANGNISAFDSDRVKDEIREYCSKFKKKISSINEQTEEIAKAFKKCKHLEFVGAGSDYASAWFGRAKAYEAFGWVCTAENAEDWMHVNYFARRPKELACVVLLTKGNPANSRIMEDLSTMKDIKRPTMIITDFGKDYPKGMYVVKIPKAPERFLSPLLQILPITLLCGHLSDEFGVPFFRNFEAPWNNDGYIRFKEG
ncbi:MAG: SIS domain-containing protein [Oscillospiraceae bacterium]|jgi:glucosamine--fructose-6-phosphate aminotransferase (isomerizing)